MNKTSEVSDLGYFVTSDHGFVSVQIDPNGNMMLTADCPPYAMRLGTNRLGLGIRKGGEVFLQVGRTEPGTRKGRLLTVDLFDLLDKLKRYGVAVEESEL